MPPDPFLYPGVREYLLRFGYLSPGDDSPGQLAKALWGFQRLHRIPLTGVPDVMTLGMMRQPRCGISDHDPPTRLPRLWGLRRLTCEIVNATTTLTLRDVHSALTEAVAFWQPDLPFTLAVGSAGQEAGVAVRFVNGDHGDGCALGGDIGVLGHAFMLAGRGGRLVGEIHLDADAPWALTPEPRSGALDLVAALSHQLGHVLGLGHAMSPGAVMHPIQRWASRQPARQDFAALRTLQQARPGVWERVTGLLRSL